MTALFVTGTGTGVGKTHATCALVRALAAAGRPVAACKPVLSGFDPARPEDSDAGALLAALGRPVTEETVAEIAPWRFAAPLSPDMAAAREGRTIQFDALLAWCGSAIAAADGLLLIEGVGGAMVPLDDRRTVRDWIAELGIPALVVSGTYLGAISHALTTLEALAARQVAVRALLLSESEESPVPPEETAAAIGRFTDVPVLVLHRDGDAAALLGLLALG